MARPFIQQTAHGKRKLIGEGDRARVFYYLNGPHKHLVGRVPKGSEHFWPPNTLKHQYLRFKAHKIAYWLFPEWNMHPRRFIPEENEIISNHVIRSKKNIRMATSRRETARAREHTLPPEAVPVIREMYAAGVTAQTGPQNVSVVNQKVKLFAIESINVNQVRDYLKRNSQKYLPRKVKLVLEALKEYENCEKMSELDLAEKLGLI